MTTASKYDKLTELPENLKEAIDWILRVTGKDGSGGSQNGTDALSEEVKNVLDKDAAEVSRGVLEVMGGVIDSLVTDLNDDRSPGKNHDHSTFRGFKAYLKSFKGNLENVRDYGSSVSGEELVKLKGWLAGQPSGPIEKLADGLKTFVKTNSGIFQGSYVYVYNKSNATWPSKPDDQRTCALIFLGIAPILFYTLLFLYWVCSDGTPSWKNNNLSSDEPLKKFMEKMGFKTELNGSKKGEDVATLIGTTCFTEISKAWPKSNSNYATLVNYNGVSTTSSPSTSPLYYCYYIATSFFTPNNTHTVETTSPATPSFAGYSGVTALAGGAYGLNVGGLNTFLNALLV
ncbi:variant erythrocyte surface antigen-1 family protein [Babesia caballi]|uniref:Variant erythrocyte surface antigen-1 family protein n=1 Tax=Babesia caballi TaxID=5871 RepID=A0AAV4LYY7_BABCB|nr:variant erythrocyte surface antigen-1 family protein [Babesia caballi]